MVRAYSKVPYPHGTVLAADVFSSGLIGSDTDFGQFETYLKVPCPGSERSPVAINTETFSLLQVAGLDMAIVDNS